MAEVTARRRGELVRGAFAVLLEAEEELPAAEVLAALERRVPPTPFERSIYPKHPGVRRFEKIVRFATIPSVKAGWLVKHRGRWALTEEGRQAYKVFADPESFDQEAFKRYRAWAKERAPDRAEAGEESALDSNGSNVREEAEENAWAEVRSYLSKMPAYDFQRLVATLLVAMGYHVLWEAAGGPDGGVDIIAHTDPLGANSPRIKVQVKRARRRRSYPSAACARS